LKRGLAEDLVIAPYASALALMVAPEAACANLRRLAAEGSPDDSACTRRSTTRPRALPRGQESAVVRSFMAHHQGMILLSLSHVLLGRPMQRASIGPDFKATLLLLQERDPEGRRAVRASGGALARARDARRSRSRRCACSTIPTRRRRKCSSVQRPLPRDGDQRRRRQHALEGPRRHAVARGRHLRQLGHVLLHPRHRERRFLVAAHQPTLQRPVRYEAIFSEARAEFRRRDRDFESHIDIVVSPEDDIELRRLRITNRSRTRRTIDVTSYAEVVLASAAADALHPVFSNLFVQTEIVPQRQAILCTRRPRRATSAALDVPPDGGPRRGRLGGLVRDRSRGLHRPRHTVAAPQAMLEPGLSRAARDPCSIRSSRSARSSRSIRSRRRRSTWPSGWRTRATPRSRSSASTRTAPRGARVRSRVDAQRRHAAADQRHRIRRAALRAHGGLDPVRQRVAAREASVLLRNRRGQSGLWSYAISGDLPIVLLQIGDSENIDLVRQLVQAHAYWRLKGLAVDLVIWNEDRGGYRQLLQDQIMGLIAAGIEAHVMDRPGGIFVRRAEQISEEDRILIQSVARAIISDRRGRSSSRVSRARAAEVRVPAARAGEAHAPKAVARTAARRSSLGNGIGGFTPDGTEYVITLRPGDATPTPWVNVLANPEFRHVVSESGLAYTWHDNAHEFRLTPWHNDPLTDASGEACFVRDDESGHFWSPAPMPRRGTGTYVARHGFGYSVFEHREDGIAPSSPCHVAIDAAVKFSSLKLRNVSGRPRRLSVTGYVEWVLGDSASPRRRCTS
jgi:hypothetical protein